MTVPSATAPFLIRALSLFCVSAAALSGAALSCAPTSPHSFSLSSSLSSRPPAKASPDEELESESSQTTPEEHSSSPSAPPQSGLFPLDVPGWQPGLIYLPRASAPRPVLLAAHGAGDSPEHQCELFRALTREQAVIVCPRGKALGKTQEHGYYFANHIELEQEVLALVEQVRKHYSARLSEGPWVYAAYSQGATMGSLFLPKHGELFSHLLLIEGGSGEWPPVSARQWTASGGQAVLFVCGTEPCFRRAEQSARTLNQHQPGSARAQWVQGAGHIYWGPVADFVAQELPGFLQELPAWQSVLK